MIRAPELFGARGFMGRHNIYFSALKNSLEMILRKQQVL
jgi:hypothetical protein